MRYDFYLIVKVMQYGQYGTNAYAFAYYIF